MGQPAKISKTNKRLNVLETFLEIFTQFVVFFAIEVMAIIGIANRPNTDIVLCLLCIIPTVALYIVRRKVNNFTAFMIINLIFPLASLAFARNDLEIVTFFLATLVISLRLSRAVWALLPTLFSSRLEAIQKCLRWRSTQKCFRTLSLTSCSRRK